MSASRTNEIPAPKPPETYKGWTNQETWLTDLWLTNEPETERKLRQISGKLSNRQDRAQTLAAYVEARAPLDDASLYVDLLQGALELVNWAEIVENHEDDEPILRNDAGPN